MLQRKIALILTISLMLTGCGVFSPPSPERRTVWAQIGTPGRIIDDRPVQHLVKDEAGNLQPSKGIMRGMVAIDEPTYQLLLKSYQDAKARETAKP